MVPPVSSREPFLDETTRVASRASQRDAEVTELDRLSRDFEGVFVRQLLSAARFGEGGAGKGGGFGAMVVDAMATAVSEGGGIGLAQRISEALEVAESPRIGGSEVPK